MKHLKAIIASIALFAMFAGTSLQAKVEIQWWHAFGGRLGELLDEQVNKFNASQNKYTVVPVSYTHLTLPTITEV